MESVVAGVRHVRTPGGVEHFDQPVGAVIVDDPDIKARLPTNINTATRADDKRTTQGQTRTNFVNSLTGAPMGKTEAGDTFEHLFVRRGKALVEEKYGEIQLSSGTRTTPLDLVTKTHGGELKSLSSRAKNLKTAVKADEVRRKLKAVSTDKLKPLTLVQVVEQHPRGGGNVKLYGFEGFGSKAVSSMIYFGEYKYSKNDFRMAQKASGHLDKAEKRAELHRLKELGLSASAVRFREPSVAGVVDFWPIDEDEEEAELEALVAAQPREMYVRTSEGAQRFGVGIGQKIVVDERGRALKMPKARLDRPASTTRDHSRVERPKKSTVRDNKLPTKFVATRPGQKAKIPANQMKHPTNFKKVPKHSDNPLNRGERRAIGRTDMIDNLIGLSAKQRVLLERIQLGNPLTKEQKAKAIGLIQDAIRKLRAELGLDKKSKSTGKEKNKADEKKAKDQKDKKKKKGKKGGTPKPGGKKGEENKFSKLGWLEGLEAALKALEGGSRGGGRQKGDKYHKATGAFKTNKVAGDTGKRYSSFTGMTDKELSEATVSLARRASMAKKAGRSGWRIQSQLKKAKAEKARRNRSDARQRAREVARKRKRLRDKTATQKAPI